MSYRLKYIGGPFDGQIHDAKGLPERVDVPQGAYSTPQKGQYRLGVLKKRTAEMRWVPSPEVVGHE